MRASPPTRGNALTYWLAALYHEEVRPRLTVAAGTMLFAAGLLGCEDAGKKPVQARVTALAPAAAPHAPVELAPLPVLNPPRRYYVWLLPPVPSGKDYLIQKFPALKADQFTVMGYGESKPLVPNKGALNMAKNRRVEFVVQNKEVLRREVEKRKLLKP